MRYNAGKKFELSKQIPGIIMTGFRIKEFRQHNVLEYSK